MQIWQIESVRVRAAVGKGRLRPELADGMLDPVGLQPERGGCRAMKEDRALRDARFGSQSRGDGTGLGLKSRPVAIWVVYRLSVAGGLEDGLDTVYLICCALLC